jgi:predicted patatin/cPLA2 family phospholipase
LLLLFAMLMTAVLILGGCATIDRGVPVPAHLIDASRVPGYGDIRYSTDESEQRLVQEFVDAIRSGARIDNTVNVLAISGGGADGAFGAGLLCGWTVHGDRPVFQVVTGVSTGALIAPFAFLGSDYDDLMREAYTTIHNEDVFAKRNVVSILQADSIATTGPLLRTIGRFIDEKMLTAVARAHGQGRRLFVMTADLDAQRPVVWNMGAIAASGQPDALELFQRVIIASASIPVAFPPQYIEVEANGEIYTEMHVDGGVMGQVFLHLPPLERLASDDGAKHVRAYVIRNSKVVGVYSSMSPRVIPILTRTVETLVLTQGIGDLYEIYEQAVEGGAQYQLAYVPEDFDVDHHDMFAPESMKQLFDAAQRMAVEGYPWHNRPPDAM